MIDCHTALTDPKALGLGLNVFINIGLKEQNKKSRAEPVGAGIEKIRRSFTSKQMQYKKALPLPSVWFRMRQALAKYAGDGWAELFA